MKTDKLHVYLDACFVIAFLIDGHADNSEAISIYKKIKSDKLYVSLFVLDEVLYILSKYGIDKSTACQLVKKFIKLENLEVIDENFIVHNVEQFIDIYSKTTLKPTDSAHLYYMKLAKIKNIATFDSDFIKNADKLDIEVVS